jgi:hypothetical protein
VLSSTATLRLRASGPAEPIRLTPRASRLTPHALRPRAFPLHPRFLHTCTLIATRNLILSCVAQLLPIRSPAYAARRRAALAVTNPYAGTHIHTYCTSIQLSPTLSRSRSHQNDTTPTRESKESKHPSDLPAPILSSSAIPSRCLLSHNSRHRREP